MEIRIRTHRLLIVFTVTFRQQMGAVSVVQTLLTGSHDLAEAKIGIFPYWRVRATLVFQSRSSQEVLVADC
jgi:hypothetical protein